MAHDLILRCDCGAVQGNVHGVTPVSVNRCVCYCDDCQAFAEHLHRGGDILDQFGGTKVCQVSPASVRFDNGRDRLACLQLRHNGLLRWYASCCDTPLGNTLRTRQFPMFGIIEHGLHTADDNVDLETALGPVRLRVSGRYARGGSVPPGAHPGIPKLGMLRTLGIVLKWRLRGDHAKSPLFDATTGQPLATPTVLDAEALAAARAPGKASAK